MIILPCEKDEITSLEQARAMGVSFEKKRWEEKDVHPFCGIINIILYFCM